MMTSNGFSFSIHADATDVGKAGIGGENARPGLLSEA